MRPGAPPARVASVREIFGCRGRRADLHGAPGRPRLSCGYDPWRSRVLPRRRYGRPTRVPDRPRTQPYIRVVLARKYGVRHRASRLVEDAPEGDRLVKAGPRRARGLARAALAVAGVRDSLVRPMGVVELLELAQASRSSTADHHAAAGGTPGSNQLRRPPPKPNSSSHLADKIFGTGKAGGDGPGDDP